MLKGSLEKLLTNVTSENIGEKNEEATDPVINYVEMLIKSLKQEALMKERI